MQENITTIGPALSTSLGLLTWVGSRLLRGKKVKKTANQVLEDGNGIDYHTKFIFWTKLAYIVIPALIGISTGIAAVISEINGNHSLALGLAGIALPHLAEIPFNPRIINPKN